MIKYISNDNVFFFADAFYPKSPTGGDLNLVPLDMRADILATELHPCVFMFLCTRKLVLFVHLQ